MAADDPFKALIDEAPDGVVVLEAGRIVFMNPTAARLLGATADIALGAPIAAFLPPADAAAAGERIGRLMRTGEEMIPNDYRTLADPDRVVEIKAKRWQWEGRPAVLAFARDVTERKRLAEQLVRADRLAAIGTLAAGVAHEVNNPLTFALLSVQLLDATLAALPDDGATRRSVAEQVRDIEHAIDRVAAITRSLRAFARPTDAPPGPIDPVAAVDRALRMVDNDLRHRARLERHIGAVPPVIANSARLEQALVNLLINALQSLRGRPDDTITVTCTKAPGDNVAISIRDTGSGIPASVRDRIFDPFFTTKTIGEGMGLGLAVTRSNIESFGGSIAVDSTENVGTAITILLRAAAPDAIPASAADSRPINALPARTRRRVLLVDDEELVRTLLHELVGAHHDVVAVAGGAAALAELERDTFDVILCDVMMPHITGVDVYRAIAATKPGVEKRFVFITGGAFTAELEHFLATCGNRVLAKPFQIEVVLDAIDAVGPA